MNRKDLWDLKIVLESSGNTLSMTKKGRPRVTWEHLRDRGAKPSVWKRRQLEDEPPTHVATVAPPAPPVDAEAVAAYVASVKREWDTFDKRSVPGEIMTREHGSGFNWPDVCPGYQAHGGIFNWHPGLLTNCREFAKQITGDPKMAGTWAMELSTRFLKDLATNSHGFIFDTEAATNCERMIKIWSDPEKPVPLLRSLAVLEFLCWRTVTGQDRFPDEMLLEFHPEDIAIMDAAFAEQKAAQL